MSELFLIGFDAGSENRLKERIIRMGGEVHHFEVRSATMKVTGITRRDLASLPGVRYVQNDGQR